MSRDEVAVVIVGSPFAVIGRRGGFGGVIPTPTSGAGFA
jgi:hypothetical protein